MGAEELFERGRELVNSGQLEEGNKFLVQALKIQPDFYKALNGRGYVLNKLEQFEEAISFFDQALKIQPDFHLAWNNQGFALENLKRFEEAIASYEQVVKIEPDFHYAWNSKGNLLRILERFEEAISSFDQALKIQPNDHYAWNNKGFVWHQIGKFEEAVASYDQALKFQPDDHIGWYNLGTALLNLERFEEAVASYDQVLKIQPDYHEAWNYRGCALEKLGRFEEAVASLNQVLKIKPDDHGVWSNQGVALFKLGKFEEAVASFDQSLKIQPDSNEAWYNQGVALSILERFEEAIASWDQALKFQPNKHEAWYNRGVALWKLERFEEAVASYDQALKIQLDYHEAWSARGVALNNLERFEDAVASFDQALKIQPDYHQAWNNRGCALWKLERFEDAVASFDQALKIQPDDHLAWDRRGIALNNLERFEDAVASFDQALKFQPNKHEAWNNRGAALSNSGRLEEALASCERSLKIQPDYHEAWNGLGVVLFRLRRFEEAMASYDQALKFQPDYHEAWNNRGCALANLGRIKEAVASYDQALKIKPDYQEVWSRRGIALNNLKRFEEALASCDQALKFKPDDYQACFNRGRALDNLGRCEEAVVSYNQALSIQPDKYEAWNNRGCALLNLEQFEEALTSFNQALKIQPDDYLARYNQGVVLLDLERFEEAIASYDQALKIKPDYYQAWNNRGSAAEKSLSCNPLLALQSSIARKQPELNRRGYEGRLASYQQGLKHCPQDTHPEGWGLLYYAIGRTHYDRGRGDSRPRPYWHKALNSYKQALKTLTAEAFPERHLEVLQSLIKLYDDLGEAENRQAVLAKGTVVLEGLLEKTPSDAVKIQLSRKFASFAQFYVDQLVQQGDLCGALEFAEQRKNLCLTWMRNIWSKSTNSPNYTEMQQLLQPAAIQFSRGKDGQIYVILPKKAPLSPQYWGEQEQAKSTQTPPKVGRSFSEELGGQSVGNKAIIYWHISPAAITTFILRSNQPLIVMSAELDGVSLASLSDLDPPQPSSLKLRLKRGENQVKVPLFKGDLGGSPGSETHLSEDLNPQTEISTPPPSFHQLIEFEKWLETWKKPKNLRAEMPELLEKLAKILNIEAILSHLKGINQLILIPHRDLHLLPLHALFPDNFTSRYLPSIKVGLNRQNPTPNTSLLSIENPTNDLTNASKESEAICQIYPNAHRLTASAATQTAVKIALAQNFGILHFTGHGIHNLEQPTESALILANNERLTLKDILELDLSSYNLACLSSCQTNFTSKVGLIDEFIGLASGFAAAGVNNVIGSLWIVDDCSTAYLMTKFHEILKSPANKNVPSALKEAQEWLRNATNAELEQFPLQRSQTRDFGRLSAQEIAENRSPDHKPYESPYYWAGFCAIGL